MTTVRDFAKVRGLDRVIERAISFHPQLPGGLWQTPVSTGERFQTRAGDASKQHGIRLHSQLRGKDLDETFLHELAHIMELIVYGSSSHGATWWEMMHQLGQKPKRTHQIAACKKLRTSTHLSADQLDL